MEKRGEGARPMEVEVRVIWEEERRSLTLEGEPVLEIGRAHV